MAVRHNGDFEGHHLLFYIWLYISSFLYKKKKISFFKIFFFFFYFLKNFIILILLYYYFDLISWVSAHCKIDHWEFRDVFPVSTVFALWPITHRRNLSPSFSLHRRGENQLKWQFELPRYRTINLSSIYLRICAHGEGGWEMVADLFILNNHNNNKKIISNYLFLLGCRGLSYRVAIEQYLHIFKRLERVPLVLISCWLFVSLNLAKIVRAGKYRVSEWERERERKKERETDRQTEREKDRQTDRAAAATTTNSSTKQEKRRRRRSWLTII